MNVLRTFWTAEDTAMAKTLARRLGRLLWRSLSYCAVLVGWLIFAVLFTAWFALHSYVAWPALVVLLIVDALTLGVIVVKCAVVVWTPPIAAPSCGDAERRARYTPRDYLRAMQHCTPVSQEPGQ